MADDIGVYFDDEPEASETLLAKEARLEGIAFDVSNLSQHSLSHEPEIKPFLCRKLVCLCPRDSSKTGSRCR